MDGLTDELKATLQGLNADYPGQTGWLVWDEPNRPEDVQGRQDGGVAQTDLSRCPGLFLRLSDGRGRRSRYYGGPVPEGGYSYEDYLRDFATIIDPDVVLFNAYPFMEDGGTKNLFPHVDDRTQDRQGDRRAVTGLSSRHTPTTGAAIACPASRTCACRCSCT